MCKGKIRRDNRGECQVFERVVAVVSDSGSSSDSGGGSVAVAVVAMAMAMAVAGVAFY